MHTARRALASLSFVFLLAGCAGDMGFHPKYAPPADPHTQMAALENRIFDLIATERGKIDPAAKTLALDSELVGVARQKSADMAAKNYLAHKSPEGETTADIIMDKDADFQGLLGENIAADGYNPKFGIDVEAYAHAIVNTWLGSADHKQNLSYAPYNRAGVGAAVSGDTVYVTELFSTDLGLPPPNQQHPARAMQQFNTPKAAGSASAPPPSVKLIKPTVPMPKPGQ